MVLVILGLRQTLCMDFGAEVFFSISPSPSHGSQILPCILTLGIGGKVVIDLCFVQA